VGLTREARADLADVLAILLILILTAAAV